MQADRIDSGAAAAPGSPPRARMLAAANGLDRLVTALCRFIALATGIALTVIMTAAVAARYVLAKGGIDAAQELPERLFPWFIVAGVVLAAQAGGHMAVEWLPARLDTAGKRRLLLFGNAVVVVAYAVLCWQALEVAEIAKLEKSPVLGLSGSHGYWAMALGCALIGLTTLTSSVRLWLAGPEARFPLEYKEI